jgi:hypothetical protein
MEEIIIKVPLEGSSACKKAGKDMKTSRGSRWDRVFFSSMLTSIKNSTDL